MKYSEIIMYTKRELLELLESKGVQMGEDVSIQQMRAAVRKICNEEDVGVNEMAEAEEERVEKGERNVHESTDGLPASRGVNISMEDLLKLMSMHNKAETVVPAKFCGSDVSIIQKKIFGTIENVKLRRSGSLIRGHGNKKTVPVGEFLGTVCVDDVAAEQKFIVVPDGAIEYDVILGFDFMARFCVVLNEDGYVFMKRKVVQSDEVLKDKLSVYSVVESFQADIHTPMQCQAFGQIFDS
ncbi:hypothetical protein ACLKA6_018241 [Drosophila palustris]